jgi:hypothetical protein
MQSCPIQAVAKAQSLQLHLPQVHNQDLRHLLPATDITVSGAL